MSDWEKHRRAAEELMQEFDADMDCRNADAVADAIAKVFARAVKWKEVARKLRWKTLELKVYINWLQNQLITRRVQRDVAKDERDAARAALTEALEVLKERQQTNHARWCDKRHSHNAECICGADRAAAVLAKHEELLK